MKIAKNYLFEKEIKKLEISSLFDYIERIIVKHKQISMRDIQESVDKFLNFNEYDVLQGKGKISRKIAKKSTYIMREI